MDNYSYKTITGKVVGQASPTKYLVWCLSSNETLEEEGFINTNPENPVRVGDIVSMKFSKAQADLYFPSPENPNAPPFQTSDYKVLTVKLVPQALVLRELRDGREVEEYIDCPRFRLRDLC